MYKIEYAPKALKDLLYLKKYIIENHGNATADSVINTITNDIRRLEIFPVSGCMLSDVLEIATDYYYLDTKKNYVFYRFDGDIIKIIRILSEQQNYIKILFDK